MSEDTLAVPDPAWPTPEEARTAMRTGTGKGVRIAVIDSGIDPSHPGLEGLTLSDDLAVTSDGVRLQIEEGAGRDVFGHGTAVAGVLREVAPEAEIGNFRALDGQNRSRSFIIAECVRQAIARGYHLINCSFGCRGLAKYVTDYKEWIDAAYVAGVHVVAAGSNRGETIREWPAHFSSVVGVGVADCSDDEIWYRRGQLVSFAARGERVRVPWMGGGWRLETGSSFAAPRVSGMIARLLSVHSGLTPDLVKALLQRVARQEEASD